MNTNQKPRQVKNILTIALVAAMTLTQTSCKRSQANVYTLTSSDCGGSWRLVADGAVIPKELTQCDMTTTLPKAPMVGESTFKTTFANNVKAKISLDYEYMIVDPAQFIGEAKYLAKSSTDADDVSSNNGRFESAENSIIDKRIKDISRDMLDTVDIVDFDQSEFEAVLLSRVNKLLEERGVFMSFMSFVPEPSEQTEQAIDVATAMRIYKTEEIEELGKAVMAQRAGATRITVDASGK